MKVSWFSAGVSSFVATWLERKTLDKVMYIHIDDQHTDSLRFVRDCEKALQIEIEILQSRYKSVENVYNQFRCFMNTPQGAKCTSILKKRVRKEWERGRKDLTYVWGYDCSEVGRVERILGNFPEHKHVAPLVTNQLSKVDAHGILRRLGIRRPAMYDMGYRNNNCIGCVKGGMGYWNKIRIDFPDVFARRAKQERVTNHSMIKGVFLDELEPWRGRFEDEIMEECSLLCQGYF